MSPKDISYALSPSPPSPPSSPLLLSLAPGYTALIYAAEKGNNAVMEVLLKAGASTACKVSILIVQCSGLSL